MYLQYGCSANAQLTLSGSVVERVRGRRGKLVRRAMRIKTVHLTTRATSHRMLAVRLPRAALIALRRHRTLAISLNLTARNAYGRTTAKVQPGRLFEIGVASQPALTRAIGSPR
jgi:hypothetical protein